MDPLSEVLSLLKIRSYAAGGFNVGGECSMGFGAHDGVKCYAMVAGQAWLVVEGVPEPVRLSPGDCFLLPRGRPFHLTSDLALKPVDFMTLLGEKKIGAVQTRDGGGTCIVGGHFALAGDQREMLLGVLPPIVHIREESAKATLRWAVDRMMEELREPRPGGSLIVQHLAQMLLVQALRAHLSEGAGGGVGWLFALADKQVGPSLTALHADPARRWTLRELAEQAGMSRSSFALRFKTTVGSSPMDYLTRWRMLLAGDRLSHSGDPISVISPSLGYESESAFSTAFKRVMGCSPRQHGRRQSRDVQAYEAEAIAA